MTYSVKEMCRTGVGIRAPIVFFKYIYVIYNAAVFCLIFLKINACSKPVCMTLSSFPLTIMVCLVMKSCIHKGESWKLSVPRLDFIHWCPEFPDSLSPVYLFFAERCIVSDGVPVREPVWCVLKGLWSPPVDNAACCSLSCMMSLSREASWVRLAIIWSSVALTAARTTARTPYTEWQTQCWSVH